MRFPKNPKKGDRLTISKSQYEFNGVGWVPAPLEVKKTGLLSFIKPLFKR